MAEVPYQALSDHGLKKKIYLWKTLTGTNNTAQPIKIPYFDDVTLYAVGNFSVASFITVHLSPELIDPPTVTGVVAESGGTAISLGANSCKNLDQGSVWYTPILSGGDGGTNLDVYLVCQ